MTEPLPICRRILIFAFAGDRSRTGTVAFRRLLHEARSGNGPGPSRLECLMFTGHTAVSTDGGITVYGFHPASDGISIGQLLEMLRRGDSFPGVVCDDTDAFRGAADHGRSVRSFEIILPEPRYRELADRLDEERRKSQYSYGFPFGDGDCNCTTWLERLGLPLLSGRMEEFIGLSEWIASPSRRFGRCV